jgi:molybdopterin molybdotransferase
MISEEEARKEVLGKIQVRPTRSVLLSQALSCFAAEDYFSSLALPNFDNSAMDGYAVVASSCASGKRLRVIGEQPAALDRQLRVSAGEAVRIFTGAPMPAGADAVVMQEDVTREGNEIAVNVDVDPGDFVRCRGCDLAEGQKIVAKGEPIRPATIALLASQGFTQVSVGGEADAAIISTGDELVRAGEGIKPGQIYESNSVLLQALLQRCNAAVKSVRHCKDDAESLKSTLEEAIKHSVAYLWANTIWSSQRCVLSARRSTSGESRSNRGNRFSSAAQETVQCLGCREIQSPRLSRFCALCVRRF